MGLTLQIVLLVLSAGGAIVSAAAISQPFWRGISVGVFATLAMLALGLTVTSYEHNPGGKEGRTTTPGYAPMTNTPAADDKKRDEARQFANTSADNLKALYKDRTTIEGDRLAKPYIGKWMQIFGKVANVSERGGGSTVVRLLDREYDDLQFDMRWRNRIELLQRNQQISATCQIDQIHETYISFGSCELGNSETR